MFLENITLANCLSVYFWMALQWNFDWEIKYKEPFCLLQAIKLTMQKNLSALKSDCRLLQNKILMWASAPLFVECTFLFFSIHSNCCLLPQQDSLWWRQAKENQSRESKIWFDMFTFCHHLTVYWTRLNFSGCWQAFLCSFLPGEYSACCFCLGFRYFWFSFHGQHPKSQPICEFI